MKIFVNYYYDGNAKKFNIAKFGNIVLATEKFAILDTEIEIREPLVVPTNGFDIVVDKENFEKKNKLFFFFINEDGTVKEVEGEGETYHYSKWLPKDTDVSKLRYHPALKDVVMVDDEQKEKKRDKTKEN